MFDYQKLYRQDDVTSSAIPYGYLYVTTIRLPGEPVRYYAGQKSKPEFDPTYFGSGTVVCDLIKQGKKEHLSVEVRTFHYSKAKLDQAEIDLISELRMFHGTSCVNIADGGYVSPMRRPEVAAKLSAALRRPDVRAKLSANISAAMNRPEIKAKLSASTKAAMNRPDVRARHSASSKAANRATVAAAKPFRDRWIAIKHLHAGVKPPNPAARASIWETFVASLPEVR